jgi:hypothetical protein
LALAFSFCLLDSWACVVFWYSVVSAECSAAVGASEW